MTHLNTGLGARQNFLLCDDGKCQGDKLRYLSEKTHVHAKQTSSGAFLTSFISLLGTDLMILPAKHKYFISADVWLCHFLSPLSASSTFFHSKAQGRFGPTFPQHVRRVLALTRKSITQIFCRGLSLYLGSRRAASCPGTETPRCEGRGSRPGVGCC